MPDPRLKLVKEVEAPRFCRWRKLKELGEFYPEDAHQIENIWMHYISVLEKEKSVPSGLPFLQEQLRQGHLELDRDNIEQLIRGGKLPAHFPKLMAGYFTLTLLMLVAFRENICTLTDQELNMVDQVRRGYWDASRSFEPKDMDAIERYASMEEHRSAVRKLGTHMPDFKG